jgi:serine O-acetyltransferase
MKRKMYPLVRYLNQDLKKYYFNHLGTEMPPWHEKVRLWFEHPGLQCVVIYRYGEFVDDLAQHHHRIVAFPLKQLSRILHMARELFYHVNIFAKIGPGFYIDNVGNIYLGDTEMGENLSITHNVTIGVGHSVDGSGIPKIGNNVWIGTGCVLSGGITIGHGVTIGEGTMVARDIPDNCLVAGNPAKLIKRNFNNQNLHRHHYKWEQEEATPPNDNA